MTKRFAIAALSTLWLGLHVTPVHAGDVESLERGVAAFQAGKFAAAIAPLTAALAADPSDRDAQLLLGIAYFRLDDIARARPLLVAAVRSSDAETRDSARIFLGLIADAAGDSAEAHRYYDSVARSGSSLAESGQQLLARNAGDRFSAIAVLRPEIDSNVPLQPTTAAPTPDGTLDSALFLLGNVSVRPFRAVALTIDQAVALRKQARLTDYDVVSSVSSATWSRRRPSYRVALGYHLDASLLGGARYQLGHTADTGLRRAIAGRLGVAITYQLAARTLFPAAYAGYTGLTHTGTARLSWSAPAFELELGAVAARERTDDTALAALAAGGQLSTRVRLGPADLRMFAQLTDRQYDAAAMGRRDTHLRADLSLYVDLSAHLGGVIGGALVHDVSNQMDLGYTKWTGYLGVVVATSR
jgi:tetratricopeptide (TPR) repeat protein